MSINYRVERWNKPHIPNRAMLWFILESEGYRVFQWSERPNMFFSRQVNDEDQCFWVVSGAVERTIDNVGTFTLRAGDRDFVPAHVWHWGRVISEEPVLYMIGKKIKPVEPEVEEKAVEEVFEPLSKLETVKEKKPRAPREKKAKTPKPKQTKKK